MKPICSFSASGTPLPTVMNDLTGTISLILKDRPFRYLDTVVMPEQTPLGRINYCISMIFEADSQEEIIKLQGQQAGSGNPPLKIV